MKSFINSEFGKLEGVIVHTPGSEVENMTPENAERALYSDILNLSIASTEYSQLTGVLKKVARVFEIKQMLQDILDNPVARTRLLQEVCSHEGLEGMFASLFEQNSEELAGLLIEGIVMERNNLTSYLSVDKFLMRPLHNLFFTRDAAMGMNGNMLIGRMANRVRERESMIVEAIFNFHPLLETSTINPIRPLQGIPADSKATLEGGDFLVVRDDVFVIGAGMRTSTQGIDFILETLKGYNKGSYNIIVQELPSKPESFIHLDMVFTCLDRDSCMVYDPVVYSMSRYKTINIHISNGKIKISEQPNILQALKKLGIDLKPVSCGGQKDPWIQEREQWHSGANFFAFEPGKIIGYERNIHTLDELNKNGYEIIKAVDVISDNVNLNDYTRCVVTIAGSELARGGGGARCMTLPVRRSKVNW
jgi:arginine deiminase